MSPLFTYNGKLLVVDGKLAVHEDCCCDKDNEYTIEICNSNGVTDDDWKVELNGKDIGIHSAPLGDPRPPQNLVFAVTVWRTNNEININDCGDATYKNISKQDFVNGNNTILMTIVKLYECGGGPFIGVGCNNLGDVRVRKWKKVQGQFVEDGLLLNSIYVGVSLIGLINNFDFVYP